MARHASLTPSAQGGLEMDVRETDKGALQLLKVTITTGGGRAMDIPREAV